MYLAISTASLDTNTPKALAMAADLGFGHVEICLQLSEFGYDYRRRVNIPFYRRLKEQLDDLGLSVWSVRPPSLSQEQMFSPRARKEILLAGAEIGVRLNGQVYVVQPADIFKSEYDIQAYFQDQGAPPVIEGYDETWAFVVNRRMTMALVNRDYWIGTLLTNQAARMKKTVEDLAIGCALDLRLAQHRNSLDAWLENLSDRLSLAYVYDIGESDSPIAPTGQEWREWLPLLLKTRLHCLVMLANADQTTEGIAHSRSMLEEMMPISR